MLLGQRLRNQRRRRCRVSDPSVGQGVARERDAECVGDRLRRGGRADREPVDARVGEAGFVQPIRRGGDLLVARTEELREVAGREPLLVALRGRVVLRREQRLQLGRVRRSEQHRDRRATPTTAAVPRRVAP